MADIQVLTWLELVLVAAVLSWLEMVVVPAAVLLKRISGMVEAARRLDPLSGWPHLMQ